MLALLRRYAMLGALAGWGCLFLALAILGGKLPAEPLGAVVIGYLVYGAGAALGTLILLAPAVLGRD